MHTGLTIRTYIGSDKATLTKIFPNAKESPQSLTATGSQVINHITPGKFMIKVNALGIYTRVQKKARPIRSSSNLTMYVAILATKNFDIKLRPRIS